LENKSASIEDIEALINEAGGEAFVFGISSGAALAFEAAAASGALRVGPICGHEATRRAAGSRMSRSRRGAGPSSRQPVRVRNSPLGQSSVRPCPPISRSSSRWLP
jgi:hypothetical protein